MEGGGIHRRLSSVATVKVSTFAPPERWIIPGLIYGLKQYGNCFYDLSCWCWKEGFVLLI